MRKNILRYSAFIATLISCLFSFSSSVYAVTCCNGCLAADCGTVPTAVQNRHTTEIRDFKSCAASGGGTCHIPAENSFGGFREWFPTDFFVNLSEPNRTGEPIFVEALRQMTDRLTRSGMQTLFNIGQIFDAKHQLETERLMQELQFEAYKDYQPSEYFCTIGTAVRSMAHTESATKSSALALNQRQMARHLGNKNISGDGNKTNDKLNRWKHFTQHYCDPEDNNWVDGTINSGLTGVCGDQDGNNDENYKDRTNIDIDYPRLIENRRVLDIYGGIWVGTGDELDIMALGNNLYGHTVISRNFGEVNVKNNDLAETYMKMRSIVAKRSVAESSFNNIVALRSQGSTITGTQQATGERPNPVTTHEYLGRILMDLGIPEAEVVQYLGVDPASYGASADASYLATLEILTKKIFQNPNFYANLYDTPANIKRKATALKAFELMLDRALHESQLRQEMAMSVLLSSRLKGFADEANKNLGGN